MTVPLWQSALVKTRSGWTEVTVGASRITVSRDHPVAVVQSPGAEDVVASWPDLDVGLRAVSTTVLGAPTGAWVFYRPWEPGDGSLPRATAAAVHIDADGTVTRSTQVAAERLCGATRHGLWLTSDGLPDPDDEAGWRSEQHAIVIGPEGIARAVTIDRRVVLVADDGTAIRLILYRGAPVARRDGHGGASYSHPYLTVRLPAALPDVIRVADLEAEQLEEDQFMDVLRASVPRILDVLPGEPEVRWNLVSLSSEEKAAAIRSVVSEFAELTSYWRGEDGRSLPLSPGLGDPLIEVVDDWPRTRVEVSFTHPRYPEGRLRRTLRVFDGAGRAQPALYASVHLMEDLDAGGLPDVGEARDGILDI